MRDAFLEAIDKEGLAAASRGEAGNIRYDYFLPVAGGDDILLLEKWKDEDAFNFHIAQAHFKRLGELKNDFVEETILEKYLSD